ncbi:MAG TPA: DNA/RNA nuclease SfsA [Rhizobiaceae bacterium]|nr:DNA/RNA nuclease SfsA [Rhizobiaceae bacterium]
MHFTLPVVSGRLIRRYKRFLADVLLDDGDEITAAVPNTGSMMGLTTPGSRVWLTVSDSPTRKYPHTLEIVEADNGLVGINTALPNRLVEEALQGGLLPELSGYGELKREQKYGRNSRIDILLGLADGRQAFVEVKNVHMMRHPGLAEFPDSVTARGAKHLDELGDMVESGHRAAMVYLVQRGDCARLSLCRDLDPAYCAAFDRARARGVEACAIRCHVTPQGIFPQDTIPIVG